MRTCNSWPAGSMLVLVLLALSGAAQDTWVPATPVPASPTPSPGSPVPLVPMQGPTPLAWTPVAPAPLPTADPGPNGWAPYEPPSSPAGYFVDAEVAVLWLNLKDHLSNDAGVTPSGNKFDVPSVGLGVAVSPKVEFGYRLPDSQGLFAVSYRFLTTDGTGTQMLDNATFDTRTRLALQIADLDYGTTPYEVAPGYIINYRIGARVGDVFFDSQIHNAALLQQASNSFLGAGPHGRLDVERKFANVQGLSLFGRLDGSVMIGQITQKFHEDAVQPDGTTLASMADFRHTQSVPNLQLQLGVSYVPPIFTNVKFTTGYQFEGYWYLGQFNANGTPGSSRGELYTNGWFLRGQVDF